MLRTLNDCVRTLLFHASMPPRFWPDALATATLLVNIRPCRVRWSYTPHHLLYGAPPTYDDLRIFGCRCYPNTAATAAHKLAPRSLPCVFLGYPANTKGYRCYDPGPCATPPTTPGARLPPRGRAPTDRVAPAGPAWSLGVSCARRPAPRRLRRLSLHVAASLLRGARACRFFAARDARRPLPRRRGAPTLPSPAATPRPGALVAAAATLLRCCRDASRRLCRPGRSLACGAFATRRCVLEPMLTRAHAGAATIYSLTPPTACCGGVCLSSRLPGRQQHIVARRRRPLSPADPAKRPVSLRSPTRLSFVADCPRLFFANFERDMP
ncbi:hypothetical protein QYE76_025602 [Lolium multiflorum]|uniref:Retroviral polymerase SH3-like domain-containing protein n=1 Tax=Lolium multiflorum TaxID=4521 RepID=A0AAD8RER2_LOLMU|nr:hypothetical protein QYE76_025602 [Lolium multiflorum]